MGNVRREQPNFVWPHYRITLDLYAINDRVVEQVINHIDDYVGELPGQPYYQLVGDDPEAAEDAAEAGEASV